jgi:hypothetical protein
MNTALNNNNIVLNIISFLIEPPVLITGHYYNNGNLNLVCDKNYSKNYSEMEITKYINNNNSFYDIIQNILNVNKEYLLNGYIYFSNEFMFNNWTNTYLFQLDNTVDSLNSYNNKFYMFLKHNLYNVNILKYNNISDYLEVIKCVIINYNNYIKICELQFRMRYISIYFQDYLELHNHDLTKINVTDMISFIREEEYILYNFIE